MVKLHNPSTAGHAVRGMGGVGAHTTRRGVRRGPKVVCASTPLDFKDQSRRKRLEGPRKQHPHLGIAWSSGPRARGVSPSRAPFPVPPVRCVTPDGVEAPGGSLPRLDLFLDNSQASAITCEIRPPWHEWKLVSQQLPVWGKSHPLLPLLQAELRKNPPHHHRGHSLPKCFGTNNKMLTPEICILAPTK